MGMMEMLMKHLDEIPPLVKLKIAAMQAQRAIPKDANFAFCYRMLTRVFCSFSIVIQQLRPASRHVGCGSLCLTSSSLTAKWGPLYCVPVSISVDSLAQEK